MEKFKAAFSSLLVTNMGLAQGERVVVFSDQIRPDETVSQDDSARRQALHASARGLADFAAENFGNVSFVDFPATAASGVEPPESLWKTVFGDQIVASLAAGGILGRILEKKAADSDLETAKGIVAARAGEVARVVIAMANNSTSHTRFRWLTNVAGARFASLPHFDPEMFFTSMAVDWQQLAARTARLADAVNRGVSVILSTPAGTSLTFSIAGRRAEGDDGLLAAPGSFGNLPAGEVYLAPLEGTAEGVMVIEYAPTRKLSSPLSLKIASGEVVAIEGDDPHRNWLEGKFAQSGKNRNIAELGIGTNDRATRPDNVLEAEKILGTVHIALGDNSGFGGVVSTPFHEDYVLYQPTLSVVTGEGARLLILDNGRLLV
jgi:leucyl aminopeptidase (aminopeptidase T)